MANTPQNIVMNPNAQKWLTRNSVTREGLQVMDNATLSIIKRIQDDANSLQAFASVILSDNTRTYMLENVLMMLKSLQELHAELKQPPRQSAGDYYTSLSGEDVQVESLDWLEDGTYWLEDDKYDTCSRYAIGTDENDDGISVWLNDDMQEVEV